MRARRLLHYTSKMFPPAVLVPYGIASFYAIYFTLQALGGWVTRATWRSAIGAATYVLLLFLMRIYDELKDVESDIRLGRAGDPRYKDRPIVTGAVLVEDVVWLRNAVTAVLFGLNLLHAHWLPIAAFAVAWGVAWLSSRWFFYPRISQSLLLALLTHNPITVVFALYIVAVYATDFGGPSLTISTVSLLIGLWMPVAAWETSRKIRVPEEETAYETYSKVFGRAAPLVPAALVGISAVLLHMVSRQAGAHWTFRAALIAAAAIVISACLRFYRAPTPARSKLQPFAELYGVVANVGLAVAAALAS